MTMRGDLQRWLEHEMERTSTSRTELAKAVGVTEGAVRAWLRPEGSTPRPEVIDKLLGIFATRGGFWFESHGGNTADPVLTEAVATAQSGMSQSEVELLVQLLRLLPDLPDGILDLTVRQFEILAQGRAGSSESRTEIRRA